MSDDLAMGLSSKRDRRSLIALLGVGSAAALATLVGRSGEARAEHGSFNASSSDPSPAIHGDNTSEGPGIEGTSASGPGVRGQSANGFGGSFEGHQGIEVFGTGEEFYSAAGLFISTHGFGGFVSSEEGIGMAVNGQEAAFVGEISAPLGGSPNAAVVGVSEVRVPNPDTPRLDVGSGIGVRGISATGAGVEGVSLPEGTAVHVGDISYQFPLWEPLEGPLGSGTGVLGRTGSGIGVHAEAQETAGLALKITGRAQFSTGGVGTVPAGADSTFVGNPAVGVGSHVMVTLTGDPGGRQLHWVERSAGVGFTVHLTTPAGDGGDVPFTYLIVDTANGDGGGSGLIVGDVDCDGDVDAVDALRILRHDAGLPPHPGSAGCPPIGAAL